MRVSEGWAGDRRDGAVLQSDGRPNGKVQQGVGNEWEMRTCGSPARRSTGWHSQKISR